MREWDQSKILSSGNGLTAHGLTHIMRVNYAKIVGTLIGIEAYN